jgi:hypothetical protein
MNRLLLLVVWPVLSATGLHAQAPKLTPSPFPVGFTHLAVADSSRSAPSGAARPLDIGDVVPIGAG